MEDQNKKHVHAATLILSALALILVGALVWYSQKTPSQKTVPQDKVALQKDIEKRLTATTTSLTEAEQAAVEKRINSKPSAQDLSTRKQIEQLIISH